MPRILSLFLAAILLSGCKQFFYEKKAGEEEPATSTPSEQRPDSLRLSPAKPEPLKPSSDPRKKNRDTLLPVST